MLSGNTNVVEGNLVGVQPDGVTQLANTYGVQVMGQSNRVGGTSAAARNVISGNLANGVHVNAGASLNDVQGNYIGVGSNGSTAVPNGQNGVALSQAGPNNTVGGAAAGAGNVISGNGASGVEIGGDAGPALDSDDNTVAGNLIGLAADGTTAVGNDDDGVNVSNGDRTTIGGTAAGARNVIAGNDGFGIRGNGVADLVIQGNYIGVDAAGTTKRGNDTGIDLTSTIDAQIGGTAAGAGNLIGGNHFGIYLNYPDGGTIQGNSIGVGADGATDVGNVDPCGECTPGVGITVDQTAPALDPPTIGGTTAAARNLISNNDEGILLLEAADGIQIQGNWIGLNDFGHGAGNGGNGIEVVDTDDALIGGTSAGARNVVGDNGGHGIEVDDGSVGTQIQGNYIGSDATGTSERGNDRGIVVQGGSTGTLIGGAATTVGEPPGNLIRASWDQAVLIRGAGTDGTVLRGNLIGLEPDGESYGANYGAGIEISGGAENTVVGNDTGSGSDINVVALSGDESEPGIVIAGTGTSGNKVVGNRIGTSADGTEENSNDTGILISGDATGNTVGGSSAALGNLIAGNQGAGVEITGEDTTGNIVRGNRIGTTLDGQAQLENDIGVLLGAGASGNTVGGGAAGEGNLISGNWDAGVVIEDAGTSGNAVVGNLIGTTLDGNGELGNGYGVHIRSGATNNGIGDDDSTLGNVISANSWSAVRIDGDGTDNNRVKANLIGLGADGDTVLPNDIGVELAGGASGNEIGFDPGNEEDSEAANTIANSDDANVLIINDSDGNEIVGNTIVDSPGQGIRVLNSSDDNEISGNTVTGNGSTATGIVIADGTGNRIRANSIDVNEGLGIDLGIDGVTPNDDVDDCYYEEAADCDTGANQLQNFPVLDAAESGGGVTDISGTLGVPPDAENYRVEFFSSPSCDGSGYGEGAVYLGSILVDDLGSGLIDLDFQHDEQLPDGSVVTATATDPNGNTSEFSACETVTEEEAEPLDATFDLSTSTPTANAGAQTVPIEGIALSALTKGSPGTQAAPLDSIPLDSIPLDSIPLDSIPLDSIGLTSQLLNQALGGVFLSDLPLDPPKTWAAVLAGTPLEGVPLNTVTLADVLGLPAAQQAGLAGIALDSIDLSATALDSIPIAGLALGGLALDSIPLNPDPPNTPAQNQTEWCAAIDALDGFACPGPGQPGERVVDPSGETMIGASVRGVALDSIALDSIPLDSIPLTRSRSTRSRWTRSRSTRSG